MQIDFLFVSVFCTAAAGAVDVAVDAFLSWCNETEYLHMNLSCLQRTTAHRAQRGAVHQKGVGPGWLWEKRNEQPNVRANRTERTFVSHSCAGSNKLVSYEAMKRLRALSLPHSLLRSFASVRQRSINCSEDINSSTNQTGGSFIHNSFALSHGKV